MARAASGGSGCDAEMSIHDASAGEGDARAAARGVRLRVGKARVVIEGEVDELDVHADEIGELEDLVHRAVDGDVALLHLHLRLGDFAPARLLLAVGQGGVQVRHHRGLDLGEGHVAGEGHLEPRAPVVQTKGVVRGVRGLAALRLGARVLESHVESPTIRNTRRRGGGDAPRRGRRRRVRDEIHRRGRRGRLLFTPVDSIGRRGREPVCRRLPRSEPLLGTKAELRTRD